MTPIIRPDSGKRITGSLRRDLRKRRALRSFLREVAGAVTGAGGAVYLAGGYLRDLAEGREGGDVDLMVTGISFPRLGELLRSAGSRRLGIRKVVTAGKSHPVHRIATTWNRAYVDVTVARRFPASENATRLPVPAGVEPAALGDASFRDFTINSMLFRIPGAGPPEEGTFLDLFGGIDDLRRRRIRFVGDPADRLLEDPLRAFRAVRMACERNRFRIDARGVAAIRRIGPSLAGNAPPERIASELVRALAADPVAAVEWLRRLGLIRALLPEPWNRRIAAERAARRYRFLARSFRAPLPTAFLLANLLADLPPGRAATVARRLRIPDIRKVVALLSDLDRLRHPERLRYPRAETEAILARSGNLKALIALYRADCTGCGRNPKDLMRFFTRCGRIPRFIDGIWLRRNGFPEGPLREEVLLRVREASLSGEIRSDEEAIRIAEEMRGRGMQETRGAAGQARRPGI